jgi:hypothetical protein
MMDQNTAATPTSGKSGLSLLWIILGIMAGGTALLILLCIGSIYWVTRTPRGSNAASELFTYQDIPLPAFVDRGMPTAVANAPGVQRFEIALGEERDGFYETPGIGGVLWLYIPAGKHAPQSLPCVLMSANRYNHLRGGWLTPAKVNEFETYAKEGCAVVAYELDGRNQAQPFNDVEERRDFDAFKNSRAGLVNARNAFEYVLRHVPEVNPKHIYAAGFAQGGSHALLFAAHEPRLSGVIAVEPDIDIPAKIGPLILNLTSEKMPDVIDFATQSSPHTHVKRIRCPTFLYGTDIDPDKSIAALKTFGNKLTANGAQVTIVETKAYDGNLTGITEVMKWIQERSSAK